MLGIRERPQADMAIDGLRHTPGDLPGMINENKRVYGDQLVGDVRGNYNELLESLDQDYLLNTSLVLEEEGKYFVAIAKALGDGKEIDSNKLAQIREAYANSSANPAWRKFVSRQSDNFIKTYAPKYVQMMTQNFIGENLAENGELSMNRMKDYITRTIASYENDDQKNKAYKDLGKVYFASQQQAQRQAQEQRAAA